MLQLSYRCPLLGSSSPTNEELPLLAPVPRLVRVHEERHTRSATHDYVEVQVAEIGPDSNFILRIDQLWNHGQVVATLSQILGKHPSELGLADTQGRYWHYRDYPEDRHRAMSIFVHDRSPQPSTVSGVLESANLGS